MQLEICMAKTKMGKIVGMDLAQILRNKEVVKKKGKEEGWTEEEINGALNILDVLQNGFLAN